MPRTGQKTRHYGQIGGNATSKISSIQGAPITYGAPGTQGAPITYGAPQPQPRNRAISHNNIHMLVCAHDYPGSDCELTATADAQNIAALAQQCGVPVSMVTNHQLTRQGFANAVASVGGRCRPGDLFLFFFAGHGTQVEDYDGDEPDGQDEAYVLTDENGSIYDSNGDPVVFTDDEFARLVTQTVDPQARCLMISDCCHSGSIADLKKRCWRGRPAITISGCRDQQTSGDTGKGGICTYSMLLAVESMQQAGKPSYTVAEFFREVLRQDDGVFNSEQDITCERTEAAPKNMFPWPLIPKTPYRCPPLPGHYQKIGAPQTPFSGDNYGGRRPSYSAATVMPAASVMYAGTPQGILTPTNAYPATSYPPAGSYSVSGGNYYQTAKPTYATSGSPSPVSYTVGSPATTTSTAALGRYGAYGAYTQQPYVTSRPSYVPAAPGSYVAASQYGQPAAQPYYAASPYSSDRLGASIGGAPYLFG